MGEIRLKKTILTKGQNFTFLKALHNYLFLSSSFISFSEGVRSGKRIFDSDF